MQLSTMMGNSQKLDGGAMFGNAPKALWQKWVAVDDKNRIDLSCRCLLVEVDHRKVLFETGIGAFFAPEYQDRYGIQERDHVLLKSLQSLGLNHEDITDVVLSHLHFDHAGGLLDHYKEGRPLQLLFPRAKYFVGEKAMERAKKPHPRDKASFIPELQPLLEQSGRLELVRDPKQHSLSPYVTFRFSDGHTPGLMLSQICGPNLTLVFTSDLIPGTPWVHVPITMGYDRYPEMLIDEKKALLQECQEKNMALFYTHDPLWALSKVKQDPHGRFQPQELMKELQRTQA